MRKILFISLAIMLMAGPGVSQIPREMPGWPYRSQSRYFADYSLGRFADDGSEKHLFYNTMMGEVQKFNLDGSFSNGWPLHCDTLIFGGDPVVLDIDHDGRFEMLIDGARRIDNAYAYSLLFLVDDDGTVMPGFPINLNDPSGLAAADIDNDNEYEIMYVSRRDQIINCLDRYGNPKPGWPIPLPPDVQCVGGSIGDLDLDGTNDYIVPGQRNIYAFRYDGTMMSGFPIVMPEPNFIFYSGIWPNCLADIDGDGYLEIITGANNWVNFPPPIDSCFVAVYDHTGQPKPGWPHYLPEWVVSSITPADIDNNGTIELGFQGYYLHFIGLDGADLPGWPVLLTRPTGEIWGSYSDLSIADLNGDGDCEIFPNYNVLYADSMGHDSLWYYGYSYLFAYDHLGQLLPGYPFTIRGSNFEKPPCFALGRITNSLYMSVSSDITMVDFPDSVFLKLYQYPDSTGPADQWPMLNHDNLHTRNYNFVDRVTSVYDQGKEILPKSPVLKQNYPNPFNTSTMIEFTLPQKEYVTLSIFDYLGRKVVDIYDQQMEAGTYKHRLDMNVPSGVYLCRLRAGKTVITRKMTLLK
jgi:hypothetical protein